MSGMPVTTVGRLLLDDALPEDLRDPQRTWDKASVKSLLERVLNETPERYPEVVKKLEALGAEAATIHGRQASLSLESLRAPPKVREMREAIRSKVQQVLETETDPKLRRLKILKAVAEGVEPVTKAVYEEGVATKNPFALQVMSGSRGNKDQYRTLLAGDMLVTDHKDDPVPLPLLRSYSEGLSPAEMFAAGFGARRGAFLLKMATPQAGYLAKQLALAAHRLVVTEKDCGTTDGVPVPASDADNEGAVLARPAGGLSAGTVLDPKTLKRLGDARIVVRSPMTCRAAGGICSRCAGVREKGGFPSVGENIGVAAAQAVTEPLSQGVISSKHAGGAASGGGKGQSGGLKLIQQLTSVPKTFADGAAIAALDGRVDAVRDAPQGGKYVLVSGQEHYVPPGIEVTVQPGQEVEAGDQLSEGVPNPAEIVRHVGLGEGRRRYLDILRGAFKGSGVPAHRRNLELLARGLVNHVRVTDLDGPDGTVPDDVIEYDSAVRDWRPRSGFRPVRPGDGLGKYLERPVLHYSIGTRVTKRMARELGEFGIDKIDVHDDPPPFVPEMVRSMETLAHSDDVLIRGGGLYGVERTFLDSVRRGARSDTHGTSYIPALAQGVEFGKPPDGKGY